jgi:Flp pilus assembly protein TadG
MAMRNLLHRFRQSQDGTALVEFALSLPLILVVSYGTIDSMRLFWSYQAAVAGVRDAARYVARVAPDNICTTGANLASELSARGVVPATIIDSTIGGGALYTGGVTIGNVTATITCVNSLGLRQAVVPVARISADLSIVMPFTEILTLVGGAGFGTLTTTIVEDARVFGL